MRILDEHDNEISQEDVDYELGYVMPDKLFIKHHEAIEEAEEETHYEVRTFYFEDETRLDVEGNNVDPHIELIDPENGVFGYIDQGEGKELRGIDLESVVDKERVEAKEAWDEYEDIQRYTLYTEEELAKRRVEAEIRELEIKQERQLKNVARMFVAQAAPAMTDTELLDVSSFVPEWDAKVAYKIGDIVAWEQDLYRAINNTVKNTVYTPKEDIGSWKKIEAPGPEGIYPWSQPLGSTDVYQLGDLVTHKEKIWESTVNNNSWEPGVYGWKEVADQYPTAEIVYA